MNDWMQDNGTAPRVLVVEDDPGIRETVCGVLELEGCEVTHANDGEKGFAAARAHHPDLIISDILMPRVDGYGMLARLRQLPEFVSTPVIFLTARADQSDLRQGMERGADDYLVKPFDPPSLVRAVMARLRRRHDTEAVLAGFRESVASMLPHELRTPLAGVIGFSDLLLESAREAGHGGTVPAETVADHARYIRDSGERLLRLVERYTLWVELTARGDRLRAERNGWGSRQSLSAATERARVLAEQKGRGSDLRVTLPAAELAVPEGYFPAIVAELVDNALKFSSAGQPIRVEGCAEGARYSVSVVDAGRGMSEETFSRIDAFVQFDRERWEQQGVGLGMAIAKRFADIVEGSLTISSRPEGGATCVALRVPILAGAE